MTIERPPTIDSPAAARWAARIPCASPWLHEEVARRMETRLQWIVRAPDRWIDWAPLQGGLQAHRRVQQRYAQASSWVVQDTAQQQAALRQRLALPWWRPSRWLGKSLSFVPGSVQPAATPTPESSSRGSHNTPLAHMVWANMALHMHADPLALMRRWHASLEVDGFLMFSCLGPDTLRQLRSVYAQQGWPVPCHEFTDMHDWGDMLVQAGFSEPVMDMEHITLTYSSPTTLLHELRSLGRNLHPLRFPGLRGRRWYAALQNAVQQGLSSPDAPDRLSLTFEVIYGHAFKPAARLPVTAHSVIGLGDMRAALARGRTDGKASR